MVEEWRIAAGAVVERNMGAAAGEERVKDRSFVRYLQVFVIAFVIALRFYLSIY